MLSISTGNSYDEKYISLSCVHFFPTRNNKKMKNRQYQNKRHLENIDLILFCTADFGLVNNDNTAISPQDEVTTT